MLRSLSNSIQQALLMYAARRPDDRDRLARWATLADQSSGSEFLREYLSVVGESDVVPQDRGTFYGFLRAHLLSRMLDELNDALSKQHESVHIALPAILSLSA